jgi:superfamily II DNA/RNA helicase
VVVGTPATTLRGIQNKTLDVSGVKFLTLDEADQLLDQKNKVRHGRRIYMDGCCTTT